MRLGDLLVLAWRSFLSSRVTSALVVLVVATSVGVSVTLVSQTAGLVKSVEQNVLYLGPNTVLVESAGSVNLPAGSEIRLNSTLVDFFKKVPHVQQVYPVVALSGTLELPGFKGRVLVVGLADYSLLGEYEVVYGELANPARVGVMLPYSTFKSPSVVGKEAVLNFSGRVIKLDVAGVINFSTVQLLQFTIPSNAVIVPLSVLQSALNLNQYDLVVIKVDDPKYDGYVASYIRETLAPRAVVQSSGLQGVSYTLYYSNLLVVSAEQLAEAYLKSANVNEGLSRFVGVISGLISSASVALILTLSTYGQLRDIGVFRALGMSSRDLVAEKLAEALYGGATGSALGVLAGVVVGSYVRLFSSAFPYSPDYSAQVLAEFFGLGVLTALLGSAYPVLWLARLTPVETIRRGEL